MLSFDPRFQVVFVCVPLINCKLKVRVSERREKKEKTRNISPCCQRVKV